jgi:hypothetical protein
MSVHQKAAAGRQAGEGQHRTPNLRLYLQHALIVSPNNTSTANAQAWALMNLARDASWQYGCEIGLTEDGATPTIQLHTSLNL